jgi:hypothetical protein
LSALSTPQHHETRGPGNYVIKAQYYIHKHKVKGTGGAIREDLIGSVGQVDVDHNINKRHQILRMCKNVNPELSQIIQMFVINKDQEEVPYGHDAHENKHGFLLDDEVDQ